MKDLIQAFVEITLFAASAFVAIPLTFGIIMVILWVLETLGLVLVV